uniref:EGF-like domain-containing protein n=1 Tax=Sinocyclocheilus grahami TaxID=75366 RepID=A0A672QRJ2_SINGR
MCGDEGHCVVNRTDLFCSCKPGFQKTHPQTCTDVNECKQFGICSHICNNTKGSHKCSCSKNFIKVNDTCKADSSDKQALYVADDNEIRSLYPGMQNWIYEQAFQGDANVRIDAMDLHIKSKRIFWTNWHTGRISSFEQPSPGPASPNSNRNRRQTDSRVTDLEIPGLKMPRGIAVDWVANNIYWTDSGRDVIEVAQMNGRNRKTLISGMIDEPYAIVVDPPRGIMYWADWGNHPKIETAAMDGTMRETLVHENIQWPTGLAVDYFNERLYWADAKLSVIGSVRLNGTDPVIAVSSVKNSVTWAIFGSLKILSGKKGHYSGVVASGEHERRMTENQKISGQRNVTPSGTCNLLCLNGGTCVLNARKQPKCRCQPNYGGERCELNQCKEFCQNGGTCTASPTGAPTCRCLAGFTGPNCNQRTCENYCKNGGNCTVNRGNQPTCSCPADFLGDQCQYRSCDGFCDHGGTCMQSSDGSRQCRCPPRFIGNNCEVDKCHYCRDGKCIPTNIYQPHGDVTCRCTSGRIQPSCYTCEGYCANGQCSLSWHPSVLWLYFSLCCFVWCNTDLTTSFPLNKNCMLCICRAKGFQHQRMTNGAMNVEIGNPAYKIYEGEQDDDVGELLDADFTLDPDKPTNFTNPVYATLYMGAHNSRNSLASTDEKKELLSRGDEEPLVDPLA